MVSAERLREVLTFDHNSGHFTWLPRQGSAAFNGRYAGRRAGSLNQIGYIEIRIDGKIYLAHRLALLWDNGKFPDGEVDHINHIRSDNRTINLREVTKRLNAQNRSMHPKNTSGHVGVYWERRRNKWMAKIVVSGKQIHIGYFDAQSDAIEARRSASEAFNFHNNHGLASAA